jgi:hypothetical protein
VERWRSCSSFLSLRSSLYPVPFPHCPHPPFLYWVSGPP